MPQDYKKAIELYTLPASAGHAAAQFNLAQLYQHGRGVPQDYSKAVEWCGKATDKSEDDAQKLL